MSRKKYNIEKDWLIEQYVILLKSASEIAEIVGCCRPTISFYLKKYNIEIRKTISEKTKKKMSDKAKEVWRDPERLKKHIEFHTGRKRSDETCRKISNAAKLRCSDPEYLIMMSEVQTHYIDEHPEVKKIFAERMKTYREKHPEWINPLQRPDIVAKMSGDNHYLRKHPEACEKISKHNYIMWSDPEYRKRMSGKNSYRYGKSPVPGTQWSKGEYFITSDGLRIWMRSTYEYRIAIALTRCNIQWIHEPIAFSVDELGTWRPDFYLPELDIWWEVKGYMAEEANNKISKFIELYPDKHLRIMFLRDIEELECYAINKWKFDVLEIGVDAKLAINSKAHLYES